MQDIVLAQAVLEFKTKQRPWTTGVNTTDKDRREKN